MAGKANSKLKLNEQNSILGEALVERFGSPLFVLDKAKLVGQYRRIRSAFMTLYPKTIIAYSCKTNYMPFICSALYNQGACMEIISGFEIDLVIRLGVEGSRIIMNGPYKPLNELEKLLDYSNLCRINADNVEELKLLDSIARKRRMVLGIGIRVNVKIGELLWSKFGFNIENGKAFDAAKLVCNNLKNLKLRGLHIHIGTNVPDASAYRHASEKVAVFASYLRGSLGTNLDYIDFGGGFAPEGGEIPMGLADDEWKVAKIDDFAKAICGPLNAVYRDAEKPELVLEPGRYLVGNAMSLLATVTSIKEIDGRRSVFLDAGINILPAAVRRRYTMIAHTSSKQSGTADIYGPLCTQRDMLAKDVGFPLVKAGDMVEILSAGAYSLSESMQFIRARPAVVCVEGNNVKLIRKRETLDDVTSADVWAEVEKEANRV